MIKRLFAAILLIVLMSFTLLSVSCYKKISNKTESKNSEVSKIRWSKEVSYVPSVVFEDENTVFVIGNVTSFGSVGDRKQKNLFAFLLLFFQPSPVNANGFEFGESYVEAYEAMSGKLIWRRVFNNPRPPNSPNKAVSSATLTSEGLALISQEGIGSDIDTQSRLLLLDTKTGKTKWESPFLVDGIMLVSDPKNSEIVFLKHYPRGLLSVFDIKSKSFIWESLFRDEIIRIVWSQDRQNLYLLDVKQQITAVDARSGKKLWKEKGMPFSYEESSNVYLHIGTKYVVQEIEYGRSEPAAAPEGLILQLFDRATGKKDNISKLGRKFGDNFAVRQVLGFGRATSINNNRLILMKYFENRSADVYMLNINDNLKPKWHRFKRGEINTSHRLEMILAFGQEKGVYLFETSSYNPPRGKIINIK